MLRSEYEPGQRVRHPTQPDWGNGQVQSVVGDRVTVNFENAGKVLINVAAVPLTILEDDE
jgi:FKBP-type peptidyl-prolyl cis-trans isomerase 2